MAPFFPKYQFINRNCNYFKCYNQKRPTLYPYRHHQSGMYNQFFVNWDVCQSNEHWIVGVNCAHDKMDLINWHRLTQRFPAILLPNSYAHDDDDLVCPFDRLTLNYCFKLSEFKYKSNYPERNAFICFHSIHVNL